MSRVCIRISIICLTQSDNNGVAAGPGVTAGIVLVVVVTSNKSGSSAATVARPPLRFMILTGIKILPAAAWSLGVKLSISIIGVVGTFAAPVVLYKKGSVSAKTIGAASMSA